MFALGTFAGGSGEAFPGLVVGDRVVDLRPHFGADATTSGMLATWDASLERLRALADEPLLLLDDRLLLADERLLLLDERLDPPDFFALPPELPLLRRSAISLPL